MAGNNELGDYTLKELLDLKVDPRTFEKLNAEEKQLLRSVEQIKTLSNQDPSAHSSMELPSDSQPKTYDRPKSASGGIPNSPQMGGQGRALGEVQMLTRTGWAAFPPKSKTPLKLPVDHVRLTWEDLSQYGGTLEESLRKCQLHHMGQGMPDIAYNFLLDGSLVVEGRGWETDPDRPAKFGPALKGNCLDIAYIGNENDYPDKEPTMEMITLAAHFIDIGVNEKFVNPKYKVIPHE